MASNISSLPPAEFQKASEQFNAGEFWDCHETLEPVWLKSEEPVKTFIQGVIQVAAGCVHISNCNYKGATQLLSYALEKLYKTRHIEPFQHWMNLAEFIEQAEQAKAEVERLGPEKIQQFCPGKFPEFRIMTI